MSTIRIKKGNDPFKKYWWVILIAFGGVGAWICMPLMETSVGSVSVSKPGLSSQNQSLDSMSNPTGAPGSAVDLSMDGTGPKKKADAQVMESLYQAPPEPASGAAAPGAPVAAGASAGGGAASYAEALKEVSRKSETSASWGGAKPQAGFTAPKGNFSSLSGLGSGSGSSGASVGGVSSSMFGQSAAKTTMVATHGLGGAAASDPGAGGKPIMSALKSTQSQGLAALTQKSMDASRGMAAAAFDGSRAGSAISGNQGASVGASYAGLDAAPENLKPNDPTANSFKIDPVPGNVVGNADTSGGLKTAIMTMVASVAVGGLATWAVGSVAPAAVASVVGNAAQAGVASVMAAAMRPQGSGSNVGSQLGNKL